ncbi:MAG TPA: glycoside hydrolase domain-containing protein [Bradyrhizobium sp.]|jgi:hypothetical protein|uniref:glycoside hydrolase domain-containing protein n=1 Tax=Bradyrhizobium sp. TaxID=376 RepID=UPI002BC47F26|nr:glycoside hydrolase domain-containing protein [Bradyrhizobium sp.]HTB01498.1 glycoside hydrolase domain-containing protein [Bradyrhizobium sp.]
MADMTGARIFDCDWSVASTANAIKAAGIKSVIRYYSVSGAHPTKILSKDELAALDNAGLSVAVVFENGGQADLFYDPQKKIDDISAALSCADTIHQPTGTPIYFAADFDIAYRRKKNADGNYYKVGGDWALETSADIRAENEQAIYEYFQYAYEQLTPKNYKVGVYGCGRTADLVGGAAEGRAKVAEFFWLSASVSYSDTAGVYNSGKWHLFQNMTEVPSHLIPASYTDEDGVVHTIDESSRTIDTDLLNDLYEDFGQWRKDGSRPPYPSADSKLVLANRAFSIQKVAAVFSTPDPGSATITSIPYGRNARILERRQDGIVGVGLHESSNIVGYCKASDLTVDLTKMPVWPTVDA